MNLVAADPWGGSRVLADNDCGGGSDTLNGDHGDSGDSRGHVAQCMAGGGNESWVPSMTTTSQTTGLRSACGRDLWVP
jgi:hypothetical protein